MDFIKLDNTSLEWDFRRQNKAALSVCWRLIEFRGSAMNLMSFYHKNVVLLEIYESLHMNAGYDYIF